MKTHIGKVWKSPGAQDLLSLMKVGVLPVWTFTHLEAPEPLNPWIL